VGGFLFAPCFVRLLSDLRAYLEGPVEFTRESRYEWVNRQLSAPGVPRYAIAVLGGEVEIHYNHYTEEEAAEKYARRVARVNYDNLFIKACSGKELWTPELVAEFDALDYPRKVCLTDEEFPGLTSTVKLKRYSTDGVLQFPLSRAQFDVVGWLNGG
jgi:uncharacterized protein (DUF1919 family)